MELYERFSVFISNSLTGKKEKFIPLKPGFVGMYVCGPTVYNYVHLGNARTFLSFDIIARYLRYLGYKVRYVRNITDVGHLESDEPDAEDKVGKKARLEKLEPMEIVQLYTDDFHQVMRQLNILPPDIEPTATGHIIEQIQFTEQLIKLGLAYSINGSVYFDVKKYNLSNHYGILSGRNIEELRFSGRKLDSQEEKLDQLDFALWKKASVSHLMQWPSPWGQGFPGWHTECTVMSTKYLGKQFDIHGGGMDLKFPHHECELAQSVALTGKPSVNYWMHSNMLTVNGQKMSKSLGNSFLPKELFLGNNPILDRAFSPMTTRFFMLQSHYSSTLDFSNEALVAAEKGFKKLSSALDKIKVMSYTHSPKVAVNEALQKQLDDLVNSCFINMSDDFNTAKTIATLFEMSSHINDFNSGAVNISAVSVDCFDRFKKTFVEFMELVLGFLPRSKHNLDIVDGAVKIIIDLRKKARHNRDFALSDKIRDDLKKIGVQLKDGKDGEIDYSIDSI